MKKIILLIHLVVILIIPGVSLAQSNKGEIKGKILEAGNKKPLPYTTIAIYTAQDTALVTFRVSDDKGNFRATGLPLQVKLRVVASMTGFAVYRKELTLTPQAPVTDIGEVAMGESSNLLKEVLITAEIPPIIVRKDTLEFNAASFKTLPTSSVEDLLKKMPGVTVDNAGNITANGKPVNKILVDGKEFFGSDPKVASRNLPADIIDKVQVMNDPDVVKQDPNRPANQIPQVINLKFKKGIKKGLFGKLYAGGGAQGRYESGGIINMFRDTTQISLVGYSNNLNRPGFGYEDISRIGGFNRVGINSVSAWRDGGFALNDISFGATGEGIQQSTGAGTNFNTILKNGLKINLLYFFGNINSNLYQTVNSQQLINNNTLNSRRVNDQYSANYSHRIGGRLEWKFNPNTMLQITPNITISQNFANQTLYSNTEQRTTGLLNQSNNQQEVNNNIKNYSAEMSFNKSFKKQGRTLHLNGNYSVGNGINEQYNEAVNEFYSPQVYTTYLNQLRANDQANVGINHRGYYNEPLSKTLSANVRLRSEYFKDRNAINTFQRELDQPDYNVLVPDLSDFLNRQGWRNSVTPSLRWFLQKKNISATAGLELYSLQFINTYQKNPLVSQKYFYAFPTFNSNWKDVSVSYNTYVQEPNAADLQTVRNNTNPLFLQLGNPELRPGLSRNLNIYFRKYDTKRLLNYNFSINGSSNIDHIIRERTLSSEGIQTFRPVNVNGVWQGYANAGLAKEYKFNGNKQFSIGPDLYVRYNKSFVLLNAVKSQADIWSFSPSLNGRMNLADKFELNQEFSLTRQRSTYENNIFDNQQITYLSWRSDFVIRLPKKLVWDATINYRNNPNVAPGFRRSYTLVNAGVTYLFMKNDRAQLKLSVYDLLNQNVGIYRNIRENIVEDVQTTVLNRYALLTFIYNIRNFGGKVGGNNSLFRF